MPRLNTVLATAVFIALLLAPPAFAAFPGENGKIAFWTSRDGNVDIYTVNPDGTGLSRITTDPAADSHPAWSADGERIAFMRDGAYIWVMDADGGNQRQVYGPLDYAAGLPAWSPNGLELAISDSYYDDIYRIRSDGTCCRVQVTAHYTNHSSVAPAWSPDGTKIAFSHYDASSFGTGTSDIHLVNAAGGASVNLTPTTNEYEMMPNWSPDGRFIAIGDDVSDVGIRVMEADGSGRAVVPGSERDKAPAFSPDGTKLVASTWVYEAQRTQLVTYNRDGTERGLVSSTERAEDPDWQPVFGPRRSDFKSAAEFCKAERDFFGEERFRARYGGGVNAYGKCVSST